MSSIRIGLAVTLALVTSLACTRLRDDAPEARPEQSEPADEREPPMPAIPPPPAEPALDDERVRMGGGGGSGGSRG